MLGKSEIHRGKNQNHQKPSFTGEITIILLSREYHGIPQLSIVPEIKCFYFAAATFGGDILLERVTP